jgi:acyl-[acyl carrier protein]--UDP-N-acetylglucosamine O-acyltransferase
MPENKIHETAIIHPTAVLGKGIEVGPYAVIDAETVIGDGCKLVPMQLFISIQLLVRIVFSSLVAPLVQILKI